jgi:release factor glutamine methyltransferase
MLTVLEAINLSAEYLSKKDIESPKLNAELLLAHILNCKRLDLYLSYDRPLDEEEVKKYREFIKRRGIFEPLQYIIGSVEFYGLEFKVNPSVLIPRQETEILVETILGTVSREEELRILDIGTGSGIIAVTLAKHLPKAFLTAIDSSKEALELAKENAANNLVAERIEFKPADILNNDYVNPVMADPSGKSDFADPLVADSSDKFDIVVSNPPYISLTDYETLRPELKIYEPKVSLTDFSDGFTFYRAIISKLNNLLKQGGKVFFEMSDGQAKVVEKIMEEGNINNINIRKDYLNIERVIYGEVI